MDLNELQLIDNGISFSTMIQYVDYVVQKSYSGNNNAYHAYLRDYYEMVSLLSMYTNYNGEYDLNEVMEIKNSSEWSDIVKGLGPKYHQFHYYIECELNRKNAPLAKFDELLNLVISSLNSINTIFEIFSNHENIKKMIENIDSNSLIELLNTIDVIMQEKKEQDNSHNEIESIEDENTQLEENELDNIVGMFSDSNDSDADIDLQDEETTEGKSFESLDIQNESTDVNVEDNDSNIVQFKPNNS